jgi:hypothetical protein
MTVRNTSDGAQMNAPYHFSIFFSGSADSKHAQTSIVRFNSRLTPELTRAERSHSIYIRGSLLKTMLSKASDSMNFGRDKGSANSLTRRSW